MKIQLNAASRLLAATMRGAVRIQIKIPPSVDYILSTDGDRVQLKNAANVDVSLSNIMFNNDKFQGTAAKNVAVENAVRDAYEMADEKHIAVEVGEALAKLTKLGSRYFSVMD